ncbi:hypothetical protein KY334_00540 [Candidatus Woesearchaeota archaeon]|nr:hypothetical protein [Candidatus Woesearchaeota archaeon]
MSNEDNYVGISNPVEIRRNILETSKEVINNLRVFEEIKEIRIEKFSLIEEYNAEVEELKKLMIKLKRIFPTTKISETVEPKKVVKKVVKKKSIEEPKDLSDFESELNQLEEKLNLMKR